MELKNVAVQIKAVGDGTNGLGLGQFTAYASVFGNVDSYRDMVIKGAFSDTLAAWQKAGTPIPVYWSHLMSADPLMNLGEITKAVEDEHGLLVTAQLDVEENPKAAYVHRLLKGGRVKQMSFAYDVEEAAWVHSDDLGDYQELRKLKLHEVSVVPVGANQETEVIGVKAAASALLAAKAGRVLSAKNLTSLREARDAIDAVITAASSEEDDQEKASDGGASKDEAGRLPGKSEAPAGTSSVDSLAAQINLIELEGMTL